MKRTALLSTTAVLASMLLSGTAQAQQSASYIKPAIPADSSAPKLDEKEIESLIRKYPLDRVGNRGVGKGLNIYSQHAELDLGQEAQYAIEHSAKVIVDGPVVDYVRTVGSKLVENSDVQRPFIYKVLVTPEINAMALPNGTVYVNSGLLMSVQDEAELAGVLAHEIAHVAARHATKTATKQSFLNIAMLGASMFGGGIISMAQPAVEVAKRGLVMKYSRDNEREADMLGMEYAYLAGYDPKAFLGFLQRLKASDGAKQKLFARMMATHPSGAERVARAEAVISRILPAKDEYVLTSDGLASMQYILASVTGDRTVDPMTHRPVLHRSDVRTQGVGASSFHAVGAWEKTGLDLEGQ